MSLLETSGYYCKQFLKLLNGLFLLHWAYTNSHLHSAQLGLPHSIQQHVSSIGGGENQSIA